MTEMLITLTPAGTDGAATDTDYTEVPVRGRIEAISIDYTLAPATTVVQVSEVGGANRTFLQTPATATNGVYYTRASAVDLYGVISGAMVPFFVSNHRLKAVVTGANSDSVIVVRIQISEGFLTE